MITPVRIRIQNIRSVTNGEIRVPPQGITALHGPVGSGKSTFLAALVWVLYGEVPGGLKQADMRRTGAEKEACEAEVEFLFNGQTYTAVRGLRRRSTRGTAREEAYAQWWTPGRCGPGKAERQISPSKLTEKITELTGLSGRAYGGAFYIAQGQLAGLAEGTPSAVQQLFEEQTGLGVLTKKVDEAHAIARREEDQAAAMPGSREETVEAREALDAAQVEAVEAHDVHQQAGEAAGSSAQELQRAQAEYDAALGRRRAAEKQRVEHARAEEAVQHWRVRMAALNQDILKASPDSASVEDLTVQHAQLSKEVAVADQAYQRAVAAQERTQQAATRAKEAKQAITKLNGARVDQQLKDAERQRTAHEQQRGALRGEYKRLVQSINGLQSASKSTCPTCSQPVRNIRSAVSTLSGLVDRCVANGRKAKALADAAGQLHTALLRRREELTEARARLAAVNQEAAAAEADLTKAQATAIEQTDRLRELISDLPRAAYQTMLDHAHRVLEELAHEASQARVRQGLLEQKEAARRELANAQTRLSSGSELEDVDDAVLTTLAGSLTVVRDRHAAAAAAAADASTRFRVAAERGNVLERAHAVAESRMRAKADRQHKVQILHTAAAVFSAFRRSLLAEYTAAVSEAATDVLRQITDRHIQFEIDESFVPCVRTAEGVLRPTRVLSGGEKATAALAFRLGITAQITGGNASGMIIADEITAAHDVDTRRAVMTCLAELGWPALMVSHGEEITDTAQHVVNLSVPDEYTGTVITAMAA